MFTTLAGKREWNGLHGRPSRKREDNIKIYILERGCDGVDSIRLPQDRDQYLILLNMTVMHAYIYRFRRKASRKKTTWKI